MKPALEELLQAFRGVRVLVVGDVMLDRFVYGAVGRISPEAPIPVFTVESERFMLGGAANVARNVASLAGEAVLVGVVGSDKPALEVSELIAQDGGITPALVKSKDRPTTEKVRFVANRQQVLRADTEHCRAIDAERAELIDAFRAYLPAARVVVLSDYAKGVLCDGVLQTLIAEARAASKPVIVDPKSTELARYDGATVITPNRGEAAAATKIAGEGDEEVSAAARSILDGAPRLGAVLITRGARGMTLLERGSVPCQIASTPRDVFDVSGAGDTAVAALALGLGAGAALAAAAEIANLAAGVAVGMSGTVAVGADEVRNALLASHLHSAETKIASLEQGLSRIARWRANGERIGFTNGCFDLIHPGHVSLLAQARAECDRLIVGLNTDASVKRLKGESRPIQNETARAVVLGSLFTVDLVVPFAEDTPEALIRAIRPDVLIKGADYTLAEVVGADIVASYGGKVVLAQIVAGESSTRIISRFGRLGGA